MDGEGGAVTKSMAIIRARLEWGDSAGIRWGVCSLIPGEGSTWEEAFKKAEASL